MGFIAGRYSAVYNGLAMGQSSDGYDLNHQRFTQQIRGDAWAQTVQDAIQQGCDMDLGVNLIEYNAAAVQTAMWPGSATVFAMGTIGALDSGLAKIIILTSTVGTPAAATPATITFTYALLKENFPVKLLFSPNLRTVPLRFRIYPSASGVFATQT